MAEHLTPTSAIIKPSAMNKQSTSPLANDAAAPGVCLYPVVSLRTAPI